MNFEKWTAATHQVALKFNAEGCSQVVLIHHNDADGISSGAILAAALERGAIPFKRYSLERTYEPVLERIFALHSGDIFLFADFASGIAPWLSKACRDSIYILDHHLVSEGYGSNVTILNPTLFGICGRSEASASTVCFCFAKALNPLNEDLSFIAAVGAFGDGQLDANGKFLGLNQRLLKVEGDLSRLVEAVNLLGSVGYFSGGVDVALKALRSGFDEAAWFHVDKVKEVFENRYRAFVESFELKAQGQVQYFDVEHRFGHAGVKLVGLVCERLILEGRVSEDKYLAGFQEIPNEIPGLGVAPIDQVKISFRVPPKLLEQVARGEAKPLTEIIPTLAKELGFALDGCHPHAAAITIDPDQRELLIAKFAAAVL